MDMRNAEIRYGWPFPYDENAPEHVRDSFTFIKKKYEKGPVCVKTHMPWALLPRDIQENLKKPKIVYVVRNPKDAIVSMYHWIKMLTGSEDPLEKCCERYINGELCYLPYWRHVLGFWEQRSKPNVMFLRYEELSKDLPGTIRKMANFLERPISDAGVEKLVNHLSFNNMRKNRAVNNEEMIERTRKSKGLEMYETNHMRLGKMGSHKMEMTPEMIEKVEKWTEENIKGTGFMETVTVKGTMLEKTYLDYIDKFYEFPVRDGDVWICGIPKSVETLIVGTTWTQEMVWMIMNNLDTEGAREDIHIRVPFVELSWAPQDESAPEHALDSMSFIQKKYEQGPTCLKTHLPWLLLPRDIQENLKKPKIVYVVRNPKDAIVSMYHWIKILTGSEDSLEKCCERYINSERMIRKMADFLEKPISDGGVEKLVNHLNIKNMRKNPAVNNEDLIEKSRKSKGLEMSETNHMRLGKMGSHKIDMAPELIEKVDKWIEENIKGTDFVVW
nr:unnamed protein product [Callosobruchus analis]